MPGNVLILNKQFLKIFTLKLGYMEYSFYLYCIIKIKTMSKVNFDYDLFSEKIGYDSQNKMYLIRVYDLLVFEMNTNPKPTWTGIMVKMLGDNPNKCVPSSYYSSVRRCLKEIDVCYFDSVKRCMVKGRNWDRFVSDENWNWFTMRTGSCEYSNINY